METLHLPLVKGNKKILQNKKEGNKMKVKGLISILSILLILTILPVMAYAEIPQTINYQGYLTDSEGNPVDGDVKMTFSIYDVATGGTALWTETKDVTVNYGVYSVVLGTEDPSSNPLNLPFDVPYYLGVKVGTDEEMTPRQPLTSVPYALSADVADYAYDIADGAVTDAKIKGPISGLKIDLTGLDADTVDGVHATDLEESAEIDADIAAHASDASAHHTKTTSFTDMTGQIADAQIPTEITRDSELSWHNLRDIPRDIADGDDVGGITSETDPQVGSNTRNYVPKWDGLALVTGSIYDNGNVGIGTTSPDSKLHVVGNLQADIIRASDGSAQTPGISFITDTDTGLFRPGVDKLYFVTGGSDRMRIDDTGDVEIFGKVGIGTTSPGAKLHTVGDAGIKISNSAQTSNAFLVPDATRGLQITNGSRTVMMQFEHRTGNVGIGTTSPKAKLAVSSGGPIWTTNGWQKALRLGEGSGTSAIQFVNSGTGAKHFGLGATSTNKFYGWYTTTDGATGDAANYWLTVNGNGNVGIGTTSPGNYKLYVAGNAYATGRWESSDKRWKKNITPLENALDKVSQLQGVSYEWKVDEYPEKGFTEDTQIGLIAQDVEEVIPELVHTDNDGYKSVSYGKITAVLVEAVKELKAQNEELRAEIEALKNQ